MSEESIFLLVLVQNEVPRWAGKPPCLPGFWTLQSTNGAGVPCERVMHQGSDTDSSHALGTLPSACCVATLPSVSFAGMHSLSYHIASQTQHFHSPLWFPLFVPPSDCDLSACCSLSEGTLPLDKGLPKISSRAAVLTYHCIGTGSRTEMRNSQFLFVFLLIF